jgi:hypothetical protein
MPPALARCQPLQPQIVTDKIRALGMTFGGEALLRQTIAELVQAHRAGSAGKLIRSVLDTNFPTIK